MLEDKDVFIPSNPYLNLVRGAIEKICVAKRVYGKCHLIVYKDVARFMQSCDKKINEALDISRR